MELSMEITFSKLNEQIQNSEKPIFIEFWASWCLPCKQYDGMLKEFHKTYSENCEIYKMNIDRNPHASKEYQVEGLPTFVTYKNGIELERLSAAQPKTKLEAMINNAIAYEEELSDEENETIEQRLKDLGYL